MSAPSKVLLSVEGVRGAYEYILGWALQNPVQYISPTGDGHPVLILPGLGGTDKSTHCIRHFLGKVGYNAHPWKLGRNLGPRRGFSDMIATISDRVLDIQNSANGREVSIIGWSLGGIYAREVAKHIPNSVRQVITLGTPFNNVSVGTNVSKIYDLISKDKSHRDPEIINQISQCPPVPFSSLYSKSDGVVHWECSIETADGQVENIIVPGASHLGLGHNPVAMYIIANRLVHTEHTWVPYKV